MAAAPEVRQLELRTRSVFFDDTKRGRGRVKHSILKRYIQSWLPRMGCGKFSHDFIIYVDGFAGPGKYVTPNGTEDGSPLVVYRAALEHMHLGILKAVTHMFFIEKDKERADALRANLRLEGTSHKVFWHVLQGSFVDVMTQLLLRFVGVPMLIFADPFGYSGTIMPMELMQTLARRPKTDLLINVMDSFALKWGIRQRRHEKTVSTFLGMDPEVWKDYLCQEGLSAEKKRERFMELYKSQLQLPEGSLEKVNFLQFGMRRANSNTHVYHLLFTTKHSSGIKSMKYSMWKVTQESNRLVFSEFKENQGIMVDLPTLRADSENEILRLILQKFEGRNNVRGAKIADFVQLWTLYEVKRKPLKRLLQRYQKMKARNFNSIVYQFE